MPDITASRPTSGAPIESTWGGQVHDGLEGVQAGVANVVFPNLALSTALVVTFPRAYTAAPVVVASMAGAAGPNINVGVTSVTTTTFTLQARDVRDSVQNATLPCYWIAIGTPA